MTFYHQMLKKQLMIKVSVYTIDADKIAMEIT